MGDNNDTPPHYTLLQEEPTPKGAGPKAEAPATKEEPQADATVGLKAYWEVFTLFPCYIFLFLSSGVSNMGDMFNTIATIQIINKYSGTSMALSGFLIIRLVSPTIFSPISGVVVDKFKPVYVMVISDFTRGFVVLGFLLVRSADTLWLLYPLAFVQFALSSFFEPARTSLIPNLVGRRHVVAANALDMIGFSVTTFLGCSLGGVITSFFGANACYIIDASSYFVSAACLIGVAVMPKTVAGCDEIVDTHALDIIEVKSEDAAESAPKDAPEVESQNPFVMYYAGMKYMIFNKPDTFFLTLFKASGNIVLGVAEVVNARMANGEFSLGRPDGSFSLGLMYGIGGVGCVIGPLVSNYFSTPTPLGFRKSMGGAFLVLTFGTALAGWSPHASLWFAGNFLIDASNVVVYVLLTAVLQMEVEAKYRGRVFAFGMGIRTMISAIGTLGSGALLDWGCNEHQVYFFSSGAVMLTSFVWVVFYYPAFYAKLKAEGKLPDEELNRKDTSAADAIVTRNYQAISYPSQMIRLRRPQENTVVML